MPRAAWVRWVANAPAVVVVGLVPSPGLIGGLLVGSWWGFPTGSEQLGVSALVGWVLGLVVWVGVGWRSAAAEPDLVGAGDQWVGWLVLPWQALLAVVSGASRGRVLLGGGVLARVVAPGVLVLAAARSVAGVGFGADVPGAGVRVAAAVVLVCAAWMVGVEPFLASRAGRPVWQVPAPWERWWARRARRVNRTLNPDKF